MAKGKGVVLLSGGLDSASALAFVLAEGLEAKCVFVDYGQAAEAPERRSAQAIATHFQSDLITLKLHHPGRLGAGEAVGRNAFLISLAAFVCSAETSIIVTGIHGGSPYYDCSPAFLRQAETLLLSQSDGKLRLVTPFEDWTKGDIFHFATGRVPIEMTYSCEEGSVPPCGICASCKDREVLGC